MFVHQLQHQVNKNQFNLFESIVSFKHNLSCIIMNHMEREINLQSKSSGLCIIHKNKESNLKPLATYFQNVRLQCKNKGYLNISHLLKYLKGKKDTEKKLCENNAQGRKKFNKKWKNVLIN